MTEKLTLLTLLLLGCVFFVAAQAPIMAAPLWQNATATPLAAEEPLATPEATAEAAEEAHEEAAAPTVEELATRVAALEAQVAGRAPVAVNTVTTAIYLLDNVGLHDLDVRLNEERTIDAGAAGTVARINRVLRTVTWPADLAAAATTLMDTLDQLNAALADDDLAAAAPLATEAHELQHDLSHAVEHWLEETTAVPVDQAGLIYRVTTAIYLLDTVGLHDLDARLNEEALLEPSDAGNVARIHRLLTTVDWPDELRADADAVIDVLAQLNMVLADDTIDEAAPLAAQAHEVQHDLSHAAEHWLATMLGDHGEHSDHDATDETTDEDAEPSWPLGCSGNGAMACK